jgi:pyrroline-5-carboxylate reductase
MSDANGRNGGAVAILGTGNLGSAIAKGIVRAGHRQPSEVFLTRRHSEELLELSALGYPVGNDNPAFVSEARIVIVAVQPQQIVGVLQEVAPVLDPARHILISTVTGISIEMIRRHVGADVPVIRAMPNLGIQTLNSMTCLALDPSSERVYGEVEALFCGLGETVRIEEGNMAAATALCACGIAFFLRAIRAAAQGGIQIGFHADEAIRMAAQTAKGAAELLLVNRSHPETEIDQVTTPNGCTIAGLNEMENRGFSSALVRGLVVSAQRAGSLHPSVGRDGGGS